MAHTHKKKYDLKGDRGSRRKGGREGKEEGKGGDMDTKDGRGGGRKEREGTGRGKTKIMTREGKRVLPE